MNINGNLPWLQNWAQNTALQNKNTRVNPLLAKALNAVEQQNSTEETDAVSKEMKSKLHHLEKEPEVDPEDEVIGRVLRQVAYVDQQMFGAMFTARLELRDLVDKQEAFTNILDGTADYDTAVSDWYIDYEDRGRFSFTDFDIYLVEKGYQGNATQLIDFFNTEWITAENSMGMSVSMLPGQVLVKGSNGTMDKVIYEDQVELYEQWQEDKKAFEVAALKEYAAEKLPQVQKSIEDFPKRLNQIVMAFTLKKAALMEKLPKDALKEEYLENLRAMSDIAKDIKSVKSGDGKALLSLLNQMMDRQRENVLSLGGVANDGFEHIKNGRLPWNYYA